MKCTFYKYQIYFLFKSKVHYYYYYYYTLSRIFHTSVSRWSPQVSWTFLTILADLNNTVVLIISICPLISKSSCPFSSPLGLVLIASISISTTITFMFLSFVCSLANFTYFFSLFSLSFRFTLWSAETLKSTIRQILFFLFFLNYHLVWLSERDYMILLYRKILKNFVLLISQHEFWFVLIPFVGMDKFKLLGQFPVDLLAHPALIYCIRLLCDWSFRLPLHIIYICYFVASYLFLPWYTYLPTAPLGQDMIQGQFLSGV